VSVENDHFVNRGNSFFVYLLIIVCLGGIARSYRLTAPWGTKDHYNWGGPFHARQAFCLRASDWSITHGRTTTECPENNDFRLSPLIAELSQADRDLLKSRPAPTLAPMSDEDRKYYPNHPPFYPWTLAWVQRTFGDAAVFSRSVTLIFSLLNIVLVGLIGRAVFRNGQIALVAASLQAGFLGTIYFGTHVDYMNEINAFFFLATVFAAVCDMWWLAVIFGFMAGAMDWPGFMIVPALWIASFVRRRGRWVTTAAIVLMPLVIFAIASLLIGPDHIADLFFRRIVHSRHVDAPSSLVGLIELPFRYLSSIFKTHTRLLGPLFFAAGLYAVTMAIRNSIVSSPRKWFVQRCTDLRESDAFLVFFLLGFAMLAVMVVGAPYVMIHPFFFIPTLSFWAFLIAWAGLDWLPNAQVLGEKQRFALGLLIFTAAFYPYGIYQSSLGFDVAVSVTIIASVLIVLRQTWKAKRFTVTRFAIVLAFLGNALQMINYRTEAPVDHDFCLRALENFAHTGERVDLGETPSFARILYCRGIALTQ
jgi:hypothetical protein